MSSKITVHDQTSSGQETNQFTLKNLAERMTVRELIRERIYQEVQDFNVTQSDNFKGLILPLQSKPDQRRKLDWKEQFECALTAFTRNGFFLIVDDKQTTSLDESFIVGADTHVSFIKLVPLIGG